VTLLL
jgi:casein kinase 1